MNKTVKIIAGIAVVVGAYGVSQYVATNTAEEKVAEFMTSDKGEKLKAKLGGDFEYESAGVTSTFTPVIKEVKIKNPTFANVEEIFINEIEIASMEGNDFDITLTDINIDDSFPEDLDLTVNLKNSCSDSDKCEFKATVSAMDTSISLRSSITNNDDLQELIKAIQENEEFDEMEYTAAIQSILASVPVIMDKFQRANNNKNYFTNNWYPVEMPQEISFKEEKDDSSEMVAAKKILKHIFSSDMSASIELKLGNDLIDTLLEKAEELQINMGPGETILVALYSRFNTVNVSIDVNEEGTSLALEITGEDGFRLKETAMAKLPNFIKALNKIAVATSNKDIKSLEKGVVFSIETELDSDGFEITSIEKDMIEKFRTMLDEKKQEELDKGVEWIEDNLSTITKLDSNAKIEYNLEDKVITVKSELESDLLDYEISFETSIANEINPVLIKLMTEVELKDLQDVLESAAETFMREDEYEEFQEMRSVSVSEEAIKKNILNQKKKHGKSQVDNLLSIFGYDDIDDAAEEVSDFINSPSKVGITLDNSKNKYTSRELIGSNKSSLKNLEEILKVELN